MVYTFRNLLGLLESAIMLQTSTLEKNVKRQDFSNRASGIIQVSKFYCRHFELMSKYNVGLKTHLSEGLSEPEFDGDLDNKFKKLIGINDFYFQFRKIITRFGRVGYNLNVMPQSACLVFNPIMVDNYAAFFNCTPVGRASDSMMAPT